MAEIIGRVGWKNYVSPLPTIWNNLTHYYSGDNNANDSKGTAHGTLVNGTTYATGKINNGFDFDGINDYISFPVNTFKPTGDFSISFWFYKKNNNPAGYMSFTEIGQPYYGNGMFAYNYHGGFAFEINGGRDIVTPFIPNDTWTHIVITHKDSTNYKIYTNGVLATPVTPINDTPYPNTRITTVNPNFSSNNIAMNMNGVAGGGYPGAIKLDEIALFDGAELTQSQITELYNAGAGKQYVAPAPSYTARTTAFAAATGITDATILNALNTFDTGLISNGLATKMKALYPFVGGTAVTHKYNFMDARDLDAAFRLQFNGGISHSSNGVLFGGVNGYSNTFIQPSSVLSLNSTHASIYSRTNTSSQVFDFDSTSDQSFTLATNFGGATYFKTNQPSYSSVTDGSSLGMRLISRISSTTTKLYKDQNLILTASANSQSLSTGVIDIGKFYQGGYYSNRQYALMTFGDGLTDGEASTFYILVQALQTALSRQV